MLYRPIISQGQFSRLPFRVREVEASLNSGHSYIMSVNIVQKPVFWGYWELSDQI